MPSPSLSVDGFSAENVHDTITARRELLRLYRSAAMSKQYTISDGKLVLTLREAPEGGYVVTSPLDPELITEAESVEEAFANARDAQKALAASHTILP
jgi:hypothetical protein